MEQAEYERLVEALRAAIVLRRSLRPGTSGHWRAECEARALQKRVVAAALVGTHVAVAQSSADIAERSPAS
jgi:hypothetical protein